MEVQIQEPDVSPLAVQGPKAEKLMTRGFGEAISRLPFFRFGIFPFEGRNLVIARSGYSRQGGFEIYLDQTELGGKLWDTLWEAGKDLEVSPGCPNLIERVEGGLLSYGNEMTRGNNPLECNLEKFCDLNGFVQYIGKSRLLESPSKASIKGFGESFSKVFLLLPAVFPGLLNRMGRRWVIQQPLFGLQV